MAVGRNSRCLFFCLIASASAMNESRQASAVSSGEEADAAHANTSATAVEGTGIAASNPDSFTATLSNFRLPAVTLSRLAAIDDRPLESEGLPLASSIAVTFDTLTRFKDIDGDGLYSVADDVVSTMDLSRMSWSKGLHAAELATSDGVFSMRLTGSEASRWAVDDVGVAPNSTRLEIGILCPFAGEGDLLALSVNIAYSHAAIVSDQHIVHTPTAASVKVSPDTADLRQIYTQWRSSADADGRAVAVRHGDLLPINLTSIGDDAVAAGFSNFTTTVAGRLQFTFHVGQAKRLLWSNTIAFDHPWGASSVSSGDNKDNEQFDEHIGIWVGIGSIMLVLGIIRVIGGCILGRLLRQRREALLNGVADNGDYTVSLQPA